MVKTHLLRREKSGQRRGRSVKLISMEESWKASTFLTSNFSLDFSKRPVSTAYVDAVQNEKRELLLWDVRVWYPLTPFVEWDFHKLGVALRWIGKIPSNVAILDTEIKNRILIIVYLSPSHQLSSFNYEKAGQLKGQSKISKLRRAAPNFPNQLETTTKRRELRRSFRARLFPR